MNRKIVFITITLVVMSCSLIYRTSLAQEGLQFSVTITNITGGQVITPPVVINHSKDFELFALGSAASAELVTLAEDGITTALTGFLATQTSVFDYTAASAALMPGESVTLMVNAAWGGFNYISAVGMLATTNDAFFAIRGVKAYTFWEKTTYADAYDAGSEANSEACEHIPGPPCGNAEVRNTTGAEGYVHVHAGIHGIGDLVAADNDWSNPVAEVIITGPFNFHK